MRQSVWIYVLCIVLVLSGCTTNPAKPRAHCSHRIQPGETQISYLSNKHPPKTDNWIALYPGSTNPDRPYRVIGKEVVSRYNYVGLERPSKTVDEIMKTLAASMGGDAVIKVSQDQQKVEGTVIAFEKMVL